MAHIIRFKLIFTMMVLDQLRQEFAGIKKRTKEQLGLRLPDSVNWVLVFLSQSTLLVILAIFIEGFSGTPLWWFFATIILLFNLILPATMARQNAVRLSENAVQNILWQSPFSRVQLLFVWLLGEVVIFWIHELSFQLVAIYMLFKLAPSWGYAFIFVCLWIFIVSTIYLSVLYLELMKRWFVAFLESYKQNVLYILKVILVGAGLCLIYDHFIMPLTINLIPSQDITDIERLPHVIKDLSSRAKQLYIYKYSVLMQFFKLNEWIIYLLPSLVFLLGIIRLIQFYKYPIRIYSNRSCLSLSSSSWTFQLYQSIATKICPNNPWVMRDILLLERLQPYFRLPLKAHILIPSAVASIIAISYVCLKLMQSELCIIGFWLIAATAFFQTLWLWLWCYPLLHPSSELRNINLVSLSPTFRIRDYFRSKVKLVMILLLPLLIYIISAFIICMLVLNASWIQSAIGIIGICCLFVVSCTVSIWWMTLCPHFTNKNLFSIRLDSYETKFLQQLYYLPRRLITGGLYVIFIMSLLTDHQFDKKAVNGAFPFLILLAGIGYYLYLRIGSSKIQVKQDD